MTGHRLRGTRRIDPLPKQAIRSKDKLKRAVLAIQEELTDRIATFEKEGKLLEAQRIKMRTEYDLEMMEEMGFCSGIENYSRHAFRRSLATLYIARLFPEDYLLVIDESHATVPQIGGMYAVTVRERPCWWIMDSRLPSALDNRPLNFDEFQTTQAKLYISATPAPQNWNGLKQVVEQIVRPQVFDRSILVRPLRGRSMTSLRKLAAHCTKE